MFEDISSVDTMSTFFKTNKFLYAFPTHELNGEQFYRTWYAMELFVFQLQLLSCVTLAGDVYTLSSIFRCDFGFFIKKGARKLTNSWLHERHNKVGVKTYNLWPSARTPTTHTIVSKDIMLITQSLTVTLT